jgi:glycosyltransferase involved in cell wall biosynthesis
MLLVTETHPIQYRTPVYRALAKMGVPLHVVFGSDFSVRGYFDSGFNAKFAWDANLLDGFSHSFLATVAHGGAGNFEALSGDGLGLAIRRSQAHAVLVTGYASTFDRVAIVGARAFHKPMLLRAETGDFVSRSFWRNGLRDIYLRRLYARCGALLAIGTKSAAHFARLGVPSTRCFASPYCVDQSSFQNSETDRDLFRSDFRARSGVLDDRTVLLFVGKLIERKGITFLLQTLLDLTANERARYALIIIGDGPLTASCRELAQRLAPMAIHFTGFQNQQALSPWYHAADVFVMPTLDYETWGLVLNEAVLHGLPAICANGVSAHVDLLSPQRGDLVFAAGNRVQLRHLIRAAQPASESVRAAKRAWMDNFSVERAATGIAQAYEFAMSTPHS